MANSMLQAMMEDAHRCNKRFRKIAGSSCPDNRVAQRRRLVASMIEEGLLFKEIAERLDVAASIVSKDAKAIREGQV